MDAVQTTTNELSRKSRFTDDAELIWLSLVKAQKTDLSDISDDIMMSTSDSIDNFELPIKKNVDWVEDAFCELDELFGECSERNWDNYQALPILHETYYEAKRLIYLLPNIYPQPELIPEPDGGIGFEWYKEKDSVLIISVSGGNELFYAGLFGKGNEIHGKEQFDNLIPPFVLEGLKRLFP